MNVISCIIVCIGTLLWLGILKNNIIYVRESNFLFINLKFLVSTPFVKIYLSNFSRTYSLNMNNEAAMAMFSDANGNLLYGIPTIVTVKVSSLYEEKVLNSGPSNSTSICATYRVFVHRISIAGERLPSVLRNTTWKFSFLQNR